MKGGQAVGFRLDPEEGDRIEPRHAAPKRSKVWTTWPATTCCAARWIEPIEDGLARLEVVQIDPASQFTVDPLDFARRAPATGLAHFRIGIARIDPSGDIPALCELLGDCVGKECRFPGAVHGWQQFPIFLVDLDQRVNAGVVLERTQGEQEVGPFAGVQRHQVRGNCA